MATRTTLGKVSMTPKGTYDAEASYVRLDIVQYNGSSYIVLQDVTGVEPSDDGENYMLLAQSGEETEEYIAKYNAVMEAVETAGKKADAASASASEAAASATQAANSATDAALSANNASSSETATKAAQAAAETAQQAAETAASEASASASNAAGSQSTAAASATTAQEAASAAKESATAAASSAESASASEASAKTSETNAKTSEDNAAASATTAQEAASTAATEAAEALSSLEVLALLDGTADTYKSVMYRWFRLKGANDYATSGDYASLTALCDTWYDLTRDSWCGYTEFYQPDISAVSTGTAGGDNADLTCTPSTDTAANQDDYAGLPLFACVDCNWYVDADTLRPVITAIDGITDNFTRYDPTVYVGVLQMAGYIFFEEGDETYKIGYASTRANPYASIQPIPESVDVDGSIRTWVVHSKYLSHTTDGLMTSYSGVIPTAWISHNTLHTLSAANGSQYSGGTITDDAWMYLMATIKYKSLTLDGILQGCVANNYQYVAQVAEEGVNRILIPTNHNLEVGMGVLIGDYTSSTDRGYLYSITGQAGALITKIETVSVLTATDEDTGEETYTDYAAVYVDMDTTFDTGANGTATEGTTYISTFHWPTGKTDGVLGNDGSPVSCTSGKYPAKLQGIEYAPGAYDLYADVILKNYKDEEDTSVYYYEPYVVRASANQSTGITSNYEATGLIVEQPSSSGWKYIKKRSYAHGVFFATEVEGSSSTYLRDAFYMVAKSATAREWLAFGYLANGSSFGGLSYLNGYRALTTAGWTYAARLSPNGNRGEWTA